MNYARGEAGLFVNLTSNTEGSGDVNRSASLFLFPALPWNLFRRNSFSSELKLQFRQPHELCWIFLDKNTEWSKPGRERQIHVNAYIWNLEKWYRLTYFQGRNRDADVGMDPWTWGGEGWTGRLGLTYRHCHVWNRQLVGTRRLAQRAQLGGLWWPRGTGWDGGWVGGREAQEGGGIYMHITDSLHCTTKTNTSL